MFAFRKGMERPPLAISRSGITAAFAALIWCAPAHADVDIAALVSRLNSAVAASGISVTAPSFRSTPSTVSGGEDIVLDRLTISFGTARNINLGNVRLEGVSASDGGGYTIGKVAVPDIDWRDPWNGISTRDVSLENCHIPQLSPADGKSDIAHCEHIATGAVRITSGNTENLMFDRLELGLYRVEESGGLLFEGGIAGNLLYAMGVESPATEKALTALGLTRVTTDDRFSGYWDPAGGLLSVEEYTASATGIGDVAMSFRLTGLTGERIETIVNASRDQSPDTGDTLKLLEAHEARDQRIRSEIGKIAIEELGFSFTNDAITRRVMDYLAARDGGNMAMAEFGVSIFFSSLAQIYLEPSSVNPAIVEIKNYMWEPESIAIGMTPAEPVTIARIIEADASDPRAISGLLDISVQLNGRDKDQGYLEMRNDLGIVAYCAGKGLLAEDSEAAFRAGMEKLYGEKPASAEADLHEQKGREGISWLQGDGQTVDELAADNDVTVRDICEDYRKQVNIGRVILESRQKIPPSVLRDHRAAQ